MFPCGFVCAAMRVSANYAQGVLGCDIQAWCRHLGDGFADLPTRHNAAFAIVGDKDGLEDFVEVFQEHLVYATHIKKSHPPAQRYNDIRRIYLLVMFLFSTICGLCVLRKSPCLLRNDADTKDSQLWIKFQRNGRSYKNYRNNG